jgi:hypothetical protein
VFFNSKKYALKHLYNRNPVKQFKILDSHIRHTDSDVEVMLYKHQPCFDAVVVVTQMKLMYGEDELFNGGNKPGAYYMPRDT